MAASFCPAVLIFLILITPASAAVTGEKNTKPNEVEVGVWVSGIHDIDIPGGSFGVEFYTWWISADPDFRPFEVLQVLNGRSWSVRSVSRRQLPDGRQHTSGILTARIDHNWRLRNFPFDAHDLKIMMETSLTASELVIVPQRQESKLSSLASVQGYELTGIDLNERIEKYNTNFGITGGAGDRFSRLILSVGVERKSSRLIVTMLIGFIVANIITMLTYGIHVSNLAIRVAMCGGAIFGAVGNMYSLNSALNPAVGSLLIDRFAIGSFTAIVIALSTAIIVERLKQHGNSRLAHQVNRWVFYAVSVGSVFFYALAFFEATQYSA